MITYDERLRVQKEAVQCYNDGGIVQDCPYTEHDWRSDVWVYAFMEYHDFVLEQS